jgi:hypothetical protein
MFHRITPFRVRVIVEGIHRNDTTLGYESQAFQANK